MLTKNFYVGFCSNCTKTNVSNGLTSTTGGTKNCYFNSNNHDYVFEYMSLKSGSVSTLLVSTSKSTLGMAFGTGNTPTTPNDYWLSGEQIITISILAQKNNVIVSDEKCSYTMALTVLNTGTDTITIREIAYVGSFYTASGSADKFIYDRSVLDTPITLAPNEQGVVTYTLEFPIAY